MVKAASQMSERHVLASLLGQLKLKSFWGQWPKKILNAFWVVPSWTGSPGKSQPYVSRCEPGLHASVTFHAVYKDVRCSSLPVSPVPVPFLLPHMMLETEARRAEFISPSTAHLSSSLGMKEYSDFYWAIQKSLYMK